VWGSLQNVLPLFQRTFTGSFHILLVANADEIDADFKWLASRKESMAKDCNIDELASDPLRFRKALTETEDKFRLAYLRHGSTPSMAIQLNQNKDADHGMQSTADGILHTMIRTAGIIYVHTMPDGVQIERILTASEILLANGFPVHPELAVPSSKTPTRCTSFCPPSARVDRKRSHMVQQSGNAMNVAVCSLTTMFMVLFVHRIDQAYD
jgi:hypothetical protein